MAIPAHTTKPAVIAVKDFGYPQFIAALKQEGYEIDDNMFNRSRAHYLGQQDDKEVFAVSFADDDNEEQYIVTKLYIQAGGSGHIAFFAGVPSYTGLTAGDIATFFDGLALQATFSK